jgi:signal transduction histidine kinase
MTAPESLSFEQPRFDRLFPFHLVVDRNLTVQRAGPVLARIMADLVPPTPFQAHFTVRRPSLLALDFESLAAESDTIFLLDARAPAGLVLKGQMMPLSGGQALAFLGSPWIISLDQLREFSLTVSDFAVHESIADFLVLLQAQKTALEDATKLAQELRNTRDAALRASRVKSEFLAHMSHELRTPLNAILGFSETLVARTFGPLPERYRSYAEHIHASGRRLLDLINDLLDLSRIEAGRYDLAKTSFDVAAAIRDCLELVEAETRRKAIKLTLAEVAPGLKLWADRRSFDQILLNLLSNAVKFTGADGEIRIAVTESAEWTAVDVSDTGIGIPADMIDTVFEPFRQGHAEVSRAQGGTGLGLAICRNLAELHGGTVAITSTQGEGTTVTVRFPTPPAPRA